MSSPNKGFRVIGPLAILLAAGAGLSTQPPFDAPLSTALSAALILLTLGGAALLIGYRDSMQDKDAEADPGTAHIVAFPTETGMRIRITYRIPG